MSANWSFYRQKWYVFLFFLALLIGGAYYYLNWVVVPEYGISSVVLIRQMDEDASSNALDAFNDLNLFQPISKIEDEIEILQSDSLMYRVIKDLNQGGRFYVEEKEVYSSALPFTLEVDFSVPVSHQFPVTFRFNSDQTFTLTDGSESSPGTYRLDDWIRKPYGTFRLISDRPESLAAVPQVTCYLQDIRQVSESYREELQISQVNLNSNAVNLWIRDAVPERGVDIINRLLTYYEQEVRDEKDQLAINTIDLIDQRLDLLTAELTRVEGTVADYKRRNELTDVTSEAEIYVNRANDSGRQLREYSLRIDILNTIEEYLQEASEGYRAVPSSLSIEDVTLTALIAQYNEVQLRYQELLEKSTERNPLVVNLGRQLNTLRSSIFESIRQVRDGLNITVNNLNQNSRQFQEQISRVPAMERDLIEIKRDQEIKNSLYIYLLKKREESALSLAAGVPVIRVITAPKASKEPIESTGSLIYLASLLGGLFLPFVLLTAGKRAFNRVHTPDDILLHTPTEMSGAIGHAGGTVQAFTVLDQDQPAVAEQFYRLAHNVQLAADGQHAVYLVTSVRRGEGKTFVADNLGAALAGTAKKVVILRLDFRTPGGSGKADHPGIAEAIARGTLGNMQELVRSTEVKGLSVIDAGAAPQHPAQTMRSPLLPKLIEQLRAAYDYVIIDTAPIGAYSDALAVSRYADATLLVVRSKFTRIDDLSVIRDVEGRDVLPHPTIVLNDYGVSEGKVNYIRRPA